MTFPRKEFASTPMETDQQENQPRETSETSPYYDQSPLPHPINQEQQGEVEEAFLADNAIIPNYEFVDEFATEDQAENQTYFENFPPGYRFCPMDSELILYYLRKKIAKEVLPRNQIRHINLYQQSPDMISERYPAVGDKEWYFFTPRDRKYRNGVRPNRAAGSGFWKATGADKNIRHKGAVVGYRKALVFYEGKPPKGRKSDWIMHEYRVNQPPKKISSDGNMRLDEFVLCRIYKKTDKLYKGRIGRIRNGQGDEIYDQNNGGNEIFDQNNVYPIQRGDEIFDQNNGYLIQQGHEIFDQNNGYLIQRRGELFDQNNGYLIQRRGEIFDQNNGYRSDMDKNDLGDLGGIERQLKANEASAGYIQSQFHSGFPGIPQMVNDASLANSGNYFNGNSQLPVSSGARKPFIRPSTYPASNPFMPKYLNVGPLDVKSRAAIQENSWAMKYEHVNLPSEIEYCSTVESFPELDNLLDNPPSSSPFETSNNQFDGPPLPK